MSGSIGTCFDASPEVRRALHGIGRTEDLRFSPDGRRLALPSSDRNVIAIVDVDVDVMIGGTRPMVTVRAVTELRAPGLDYPHGVDFLDDATIVVANRYADVTLFRLPPCDGAAGRAELTPIDLPRDRGFDLLNGPSALAITSGADGDPEVLVGHRRADVLTSHVLRADAPGAFSVTTNDVLLHRWIAIIDGVAVSPDHAWIAVSNPWHQNVLLYERSSSLDESEPRCILRGASYPHGVRFSADGRHLFVADAGSPYVHVHAQGDGGWSGVQHPAASLRVMDDDVFRHGRANCREGGPKGVDLDRRGQVLAVTSEHQPLAFFDVSTLLTCATGHHGDHERHVRYELGLVRAADALFDERVAALKASRTYRMAERLQRLSSLRPRRRR